jgi:hypothetical protein
MHLATFFFSSLRIELAVRRVIHLSAKHHRAIPKSARVGTWIPIIESIAWIVMRMQRASRGRTPAQIAWNQAERYSRRRSDGRAEHSSGRFPPRQPATTSTIWGLSLPARVQHQRNDKKVHCGINLPEADNLQGMDPKAQILPKTLASSSPSGNTPVQGRTNRNYLKNEQKEFSVSPDPIYSWFLSS